jgi:hypothetical protein
MIDATNFVWHQVCPNTYRVPFIHALVLIFLICCANRGKQARTIVFVQSTYPGRHDSFIAQVQLHVLLPSIFINAHAGITGYALVYPGKLTKKPMMG